MNGESRQIILAGEGGQGLLFMGMMLSEAAIKEGKNAAQTASYGIASRGGFSKAEVVINSGEIWYPGVTKPDLILALSGEALDKYLHRVPPGCMLVYDSDACPAVTEGHIAPDSLIHPLPLSSAAAALARKRGQKVLVNMVSLGAVTGFTGVVSRKGLEDVFKAKFPPAMVEYNLEAIDCGLELASPFFNRS